MPRTAQTQADYRRSINPKDQFGRKWGMSIEIRTGEPTGAVLPAWGAVGDPLRTPMHLVKMVKDENGQAELGRCTVDFPAWIAEIEHAEKQWYDRLYENALAKNLELTDLATLETHKILLGLTGPKPWPSSDVLRQAVAGDRKLLGFEPLTAVERALLKIPTLEDLKAGTVKAAGTLADGPPENYQDFVKWAFSTGQATDLATVGKLWSEHRARLQAA
jgi:hypothetical protein